MRTCEHLIVEYLSDMGEPTGHCPCHNWYLDKYSYYQWAGKELLKRLKANPETPPTCVIKTFMYDAEEFTMYNKRAEKIFMIVLEFLENMLDLVRAGYPEP